MQHCRFRAQALEELDLFGPPHPGEIFREDLMPRLKISRKTLAQDLGVSYSTVSRLLNGRRRVNRNLAAGLARISGTSMLYWLVLQAHHDAWIAGRGDRFDAAKRVRVVELAD